MDAQDHDRERPNVVPLPFLVAASGRVTDQATSAQYPDPLTARKMLMAPLISSDATSMNAMAVKRIRR